MLEELFYNILIVYISCLLRCGVSVCICLACYIIREVEKFVAKLNLLILWLVVSRYWHKDWLLHLHFK
jgi:hypothetical protein